MMVRGGRGGKGGREGGREGGRGKEGGWGVREVGEYWEMEMRIMGMASILVARSVILLCIFCIFC